MRIAYFDCFSGASGDMILGALVDAGLRLDDLREALAALPVGGYALEAERVTRAGMAATKVHVRLDAAPQPHRTLRDILDIFDQSGLVAADRERAGLVFLLLAEAEGRVHGVPADKIHFHEVGAVDAIVDIVGSVIGLRMLGVEEVYVSALPLGGGTVRAAHGVLPVPAPATLELLAAAGAPTRPAAADEPRMELVTPTSAAILTALGHFERPAMRLAAIGTGAGGRDLPGRPNVLRVWLGETDARDAVRTMTLAETNIDDMSGEMFGHAMERLFAAGAADVWFTPIQMKKDRPGVMLSVLCRLELEQQVVAALLHETTTLGVRVREVRRYEAERERFDFSSSLGQATVKVKRLTGEPPHAAPEYDVCRGLAASSGLPLLEVYRIVTAEALAALAEASQG
ncbi:MAG: nickel pincer cofactor biosynthesis protein LarC [Chloroflexi bacterium]|nr:nickel pincer cofactor biosynthesis protein LarC [Chloroflexota bacterium]